MEVRSFCSRGLYHRLKTLPPQRESGATKQLVCCYLNKEVGILQELAANK
jgi:hypothetical protein